MLKSPASLLPSTFSQHASSLLQHVQQGASRIELVYTAHDRWPCRPSSPLASSESPLRISVLDSSFNPPTLAHLALANIPPRPPSVASLDIPLPDDAREDYDAKLLLLSVRNADKMFKIGDATPIQRLEMMYLVAKEISSSSQAVAQGSNVAVGIIDEPTFVGKSTVLIQYLRVRLQALFSEKQPPVNPPKPQLTFTMGYDTLIRLISPRFYPSESDMHRALQKFLSSAIEACNIVCARRPPAGPNSLSYALAEGETLETFERLIGEKRVSLVNIGEDEQTHSSTAVRTKIQAADDSWKGVVLPSIAQYIEQASLYSIVQPLTQ